MRYFIAKDGIAVVDKLVMSGDDQKIDAIISQYKRDHSTLQISETDLVTFDATLTDAQIKEATKDQGIAAAKVVLHDPKASTDDRVNALIQILGL